MSTRRKQLWSKSGGECLLGAPNQNAPSMKAHKEAEQLAQKFIAKWHKQGYSVRDLELILYHAASWAGTWTAISAIPVSKPRKIRRPRG